LGEKAMPVKRGGMVGRADYDAFSELEPELQVAVGVYKLNMIDQPASWERLIEFFDGVLRPADINEALCSGMVGLKHDAQGRPVLVESRKLYVVSDNELQKVRGIYETRVRPHEKLEEQLYLDPATELLLQM